MFKEIFVPKVVLTLVKEDMKVGKDHTSQLLRKKWSWGNCYTIYSRYLLSHIEKLTQ